MERVRSVMSRCMVAGACAAIAGSSFPLAAHAHGFSGQRFFPATIATDDPFVADELSLPTVSRTRSNASDDAPGARQTSVSIDISKRITRDFGLSLGAARQHIAFGGGLPSVTGNGNVELGAKYQLLRIDRAESLVAAGLTWEIGGSGSRSVADSFDTWTPTLYGGKGFGNLPAGYEMLRPFAVTGTLGVAIPSRSSTSTPGTDPDTGATVTRVERHPHVLQLGMSLQYSLPYLQSFVRDFGLSAPWNHMIPIVEFAFEKPLDRVDDRRSTGTVNPGVLWVGRTIQLGLEAVVPINGASGRGVGVQAQLHFFLDDLFPQGIGKPLLARTP